MKNIPANYNHTPVLSNVVMNCLNLSPGEIAVDVTAGYGGHLNLIANKIGKTGKIIALDQDINTHKLDAAGGVVEKFKNRIKLFHAPFSLLPKILKDNNIHQIDALLCDFGVSSPQLDIASRGFSFMKDGPIDMRMNQKSNTTAYDILKNTSENELANIIYQFGNEKFSRRIAKSIKYNWPIKNSTITLSKLILKAMGSYKRRKIHPATKTFQALRIIVNKELDELDSLLKNFSSLLAINARAVFISFHSLEDRKVKHALKNLANKNQKISCFKLFNKKPIIANLEEIKINKRSRSAKLRAIIKTANNCEKI